MFMYEAKVLRVVDGDTMHLLIDLGFKVHVETTVRLARINAPDDVNFGAHGINDPAKKFIEERLPPSSICVVQISKAEKYGRWLADVYYQPGEMNRDNILKNPLILNDELMREGLAQPYAGGKK